MLSEPHRNSISKPQLWRYGIMEMVPYDVSGPMDVFLGVAASGALVLGVAMVFFRGLSLKIRLLGAACFLAGLLMLLKNFKG